MAKFARNCQMPELQKLEPKSGAFLVFVYMKFFSCSCKKYIFVLFFVLMHISDTGEDLCDQVSCCCGFRFCGVCCTVVQRLCEKSDGSFLMRYITCETRVILMYTFPSVFYNLWHRSLKSRII